MPPRKPRRTPPPPKTGVGERAVIENAGIVVEQPIVNTIEENYMPYAMSVIVSRAIPEIDGFKPSHRKILYTMYKMGLLTGARTKSANVVGQTMRLNPHGDAAIYETMVRLARGNEALLHPYVDSKGNFGKAYSRDMAYAASRYTEVKLDPICQELFRDIDKDTTDFIENYDNTMLEPTLLPVTFPTILVNANMGIAVGMASSICPFNLAEVCEAAEARMKNPDADLSAILKGPDFPSGGFLLCDAAELEKVYRTGRGSLRVRCRYIYDKENNCIEIDQLPPTTTVEAVMDKIIELIKGGRIREISDMRDETDLSGLKLTIDLKRGVDPEKLMQRLWRLTPLEDSFSCNFNLLIGGTPRVLGVYDILAEWTAFREECIRRRVFFDLKKQKEKLHLLMGLQKILLDIDKAVQIVRETEEEREVVPNLMIGFGIDQVQAEYVAEIRLRHLNRQYILERIAEVDSLKEQIAEMEAVLEDKKKVRAIIIAELRAVAQKYGAPRKTMLLYGQQSEPEEPEEETPDYPVNLFFTREGYFKKITPQSLRMSGEQKLKEGDAVTRQVEGGNAADLLFFSDRCQVYKSRASEFDDTKASVMGDFIPARMGMEEGESARYMAVTKDYSGYMLFFFKNGKVAKVELKSYETKTRRRRLLAAYSDKAEVAAFFQIDRDQEFLLTASSGRMLLLHTGAIAPKTTKNTQGVAVMTLKKNAFLQSVQPYREGMVQNPHRLRMKTLPSAGALPKPEDLGEQLQF